MVTRALVVGGVSLVLVGAAPMLPTTRVTIQDLKAFPDRYDGQTVSLECYYDKESPIWVSALPNADEWIGFFVTGKPDKALTWTGEYYNLLFAPAALRETMRALRGGDKITIIGEVFRYHSTSLEGAGIRVRQLLQGWGPSSKVLGTTTPPAASQPDALESPTATVNAASPQTPDRLNSSSDSTGKYAVTINGKRYEGLRFSDRYNFDGVDFQVDPIQERGQ
ncbi:MAG: hypothetical protein HY737_05110 [Candidatus Omnitrophica bacterium]|nr:hypothetical protein [Candidatus Omnitrophota bacterium]